MKKLIPLGDRVLMKRKEKENKGGLILNDVSPYFEVVAVGKEAKSVKKGMTVLPSGYALRPINLDDIEYHIISEEDILAICEV